MKLARRIAVVTTMIGMTAAVNVPAASADTANVAAPRSIVAGANYTGVIANGLVVAFECHAAAVGAAVSVAITTCRVTTGGSNYRIALPGPAAAVAGTATVPFAPFQVCWAATATYVDSSTKSTSGCTQLPSVSGAPSLAGSGVSMA